MALFTPMAYWGEASTPVPPAFSPTSIPNLAGWYDASDTTSYIKNGTTITGISSQGNYGDNLGVIGNSNPVTGTQQNGLDCLYFGGSTAFENSNYDDLVNSGGYHFGVGVFRPMTVDAARDSLWSLNSYRGYAVSANASTQFWGEVDLGNGVGSSGVLGPISTVNRENSWIIYTVTFSNEMGWRRIRHFLNGDGFGFSSNQYMEYLTSLQTSQRLCIMANRGGGKKLTGRFGELVLFNGDPSAFYDAWRYSRIAEGYLAWKWGLQGNLPSYHPYKNNPPI
jgi:hypothetical protein